MQKNQLLSILKIYSKSREYKKSISQALLQHWIFPICYYICIMYTIRILLFRLPKYRHQGAHSLQTHILLQFISILSKTFQVSPNFCICLKINWVACDSDSHFNSNLIRRYNSLLNQVGKETAASILNIIHRLREFFNEFLKYFF